jgi:hypothetical protein
MRAPHDPSLDVHMDEVIINDEVLRWEWLDVPYDDHIATDALPHFTHKEVHVGVSHADADDGHGSASISTGDGEKATVGRQRMRRRSIVKVRRYALSAGWTSDGDLCM